MSPEQFLKDSSFSPSSYSKIRCDKIRWGRGWGIKVEEEGEEEEGGGEVEYKKAHAVLKVESIYYSLKIIRTSQIFTSCILNNMYFTIYKIID